MHVSNCDTYMPLQLGQGYVREHLKSSLKKIFGRCGDLIKHFEVPLSKMLHDILGHGHLQWNPSLIKHYTNFWIYHRTGPYYQVWPYYQRSIYGLYIKSAPFFGDLKKIPETKNNNRFYILKLYFLLHYNRFSCSVTSLLNIALQSWWILFKIRKIDVFWPNRCFLLLS